MLKSLYRYKYTYLYQEWQKAVVEALAQSKAFDSFGSTTAITSLKSELADKEEGISHLEACVEWWEEVVLLTSGMGCWAIGGPMSMQGMQLGWGNVDDEESKRALEKAYEMGVNFFDTADVDGLGHSEELIGEVFSGRRGELVIASKFGMVFNESEMTGFDASPAYVQQAVEASLRRLKTDYIDLYQLHLADYPHEEAEKTMEALEDLVSAGNESFSRKH